MENKTYNGWKNRATWNVALWIDNEEWIYRACVDFMKTYKGKKPYTSFIRSMGMQEERTPDRFKWLSSSLCYSELNKFMKDFIED